MYQLPDLPFDKKVFEPIITEEGFDYHHGKHHNAYVNNLNRLIQDTHWSELPLEKIIVKSLEEQNIGLFNNAAQHFNHSFYWNCLSEKGGGLPKGHIAQLIDSGFGSFENFKQQFSQAAVQLFGSGWAWLVLNKEDKLDIASLKDANTPITNGQTPILTLDVWEHAYYIDHRNQRPRFVEGFWEMVNWDFANQNLKGHE
ncbi:superoxide dismutase [Rapidithrix thailandica]|uniref:Superoxide dismutase n=1 Tax=Rapidithrix thailandica TaxID=413964 RepID=A0AAW9S3Y8_9BACT